MKTDKGKFERRSKSYRTHIKAVNALAAQTSPQDSRIFLVAHQQSLFCKEISRMSLTPFFLCATSLQQELAFHGSDAPFQSLSAVCELLPLHHTVLNALWLSFCMQEQSFGLWEVPWLM